MATTHHINQDTARQVRTELLDTIGSENTPNQWMHFMITVRRNLPEVLSRGRPSRAAIENSVIGAFGFSSWRALLETPIAQGGLGISWSTWRQWSRAWAIVSKHPVLKDQSLSAAQINRLYEHVRAEGIAFPTSSQDVQKLRKSLSAREKSLRSAPTERTRELEDLYASTEAATKEVFSEMKTLQRRQESLETEVRHLHEKLEKLQHQTFWQQLRAVFSSR